jgi:hypothetical protein
MSTAVFPRVRVGEPLRHQQVSVFPLFVDAPAPVEYVLGADAINEGSVLVEEISEAGSVPTLSVTNKADVRVLFLEGEQLIGAKQNRILNTSILVAAGSRTTIPVSCVEQGRWRLKSKLFASSGTHSPSKLRYALKRSVSDSVKRGRGHRSDQAEVWAEVDCLQTARGVTSATSAMEDTFASYREQLAELQDQFGYVEGACGVAVALGKQIVCLDLFDKPSTCRKVWDRLLSGALLESFAPGTDENQAGVGDVESFIAELGAAPWESALAAGEGQEFRGVTERGSQASALCFSDRIVHGSAVAAGQD